ncbi:pseudouridine synthase [Pseudomonas sp. AU11447]|uniref:YqcC family protein n=1 Tax=unclassified Pseudomonas TaxID=196821 RepID=UPI0006D49149|nr:MULTISPECIES: YqcC family protein [unclassified Pseudomonas]OBY93426.1 pseudouridine synthase [Pseudomonas sp. AU11447]
MDGRVLAVADQLLLIEREMRAIGLWGSESPSTDRLSSVEPFCVDTLALEEWLQWIFLPRMKLIIESGADLPTASGIRAIAEMAYANEGARVAGLLDALGAFDQLISPTP